MSVAKPVQRVPLIALLLLTISLTGCVSNNCCQDQPSVADIDGNASNWAFLWVAGYRDTWLDDSAPNPGAGCDTELRFGQFVESVRRVHIDFMLPQLPTGARITEARLNLYHPARRGDGTTDDIDVPVQRIVTSWQACPQSTSSAAFSPGMDFRIDLRSQDWSGTEDISTLINTIYANPLSHQGFAMHYLSGGGNPVQKSFYSDNHLSRTRLALGLAPRLLLRVQLPPGVDASAITLPPIPPNHDLSDVARRPPGPGIPAFLPAFLRNLLSTPSTNVLMMQVAQGSASGPWPAAWNVAIAGVP